MSAARISGPGFGALAQRLGKRAAHRQPSGLILLLAVVIAIATWLPIERAAAANARSDQVILFAGRDFSGATKTWSLKPDQPFLAVPYAGDDFRPVSPSIKLGADVGVLLFELPFFSTIDETCEYQLGDAGDPELWWRSDKAMFVPGPEERGPVEGNLRPQEIASLILYRRASGPPPGALLLERRRYVNWDCSAPTKARAYRRLFVPVAAPPHRQGCFNLDVGLSYGSSGKAALDFSAASELLLMQPYDLAADYARIDHTFTVGLHDDRDCAGAGATFSHPGTGARRFDLKRFDFDRKARSVMLRYDQGAYDGILLAVDQGTEGTGEPVPEPATKLTAEPATKLTAEPATKLTAEPTAEPMAEPMAEPAVESAAESESLEAPAITETTGNGEGAADGPEPEGGSIAAAAASLAGESETVPQAASEVAPESAAESAAKSKGSDVSAGSEPEPATAPSTSAPSTSAPTATQLATAAPTAASVFGEASSSATTQTTTATSATTTTSVSGEAEPAASAGSLPSAGEAVPEAEAPETGALDSESPEAEFSQLEAPETETPPSEATGFLVLPEAEPEAVVAGQTFKFPLLQGYRLNACLYQQEGCGEEAASEWCKARGFAGGSVSFELDENIGSLFPTLALGDRQLCANFVCDSFKEITCLP